MPSSSSSSPSQSAPGSASRCRQQFDRNGILQRSNFILCLIMQVVNEYERAVIFRLGESYIRTYFQPNSLFLSLASFHIFYHQYQFSMLRSLEAWRCSGSWTLLCAALCRHLSQGRPEQISSNIFFMISISV